MKYYNKGIAKVPQKGMKMTKLQLQGTPENILNGSQLLSSMLKEIFIIQETKTQYVQRTKEFQIHCFLFY